MKLYSRNMLRPLLLALIPCTCLLLPVAAGASPAGDALISLTGRAETSRKVSLAQLGFANAPVVLDRSNPHRAFYIPVSEGVELVAGSIDFHARYHTSDHVRAGVVLSIDGRAQDLKMAEATSGAFKDTVTVMAGERTNRFVRLDVDWETDTAGQDTVAPASATAQDTATAAVQCQSLPEDRLVIEPQTTLNYRYNSISISTLKQAWEMLPSQPVLLVAGKPLSVAGFDTAWRVGALLEQLGRPARIRTLPVVGDEVDVSDVSVPRALAPIAAYGSLTGRSRLRLTDQAQIGALLTLGASAVSANLAIVDAGLEQQIAQSVDALQMQLAEDADALRALTIWRAQRMPLASSDLAKQQVSLAAYATSTMITIQVRDSKQSFDAFTHALRPVLTASEIRTTALAPVPASADGRVTLLSPGSAAPAFMVAERGNWTTTIPLAALSADGQMANGITVDVSATPDPSGVAPVMTLFWNDILLDARQLKANNQPERLTTRVPPYVMSRVNAIRVSVQRVPESAPQTAPSGCDGAAGGYPVTVLPTSHIVKGAPEPDGTFPGLLPLLMHDPQLFVGEDELTTPQTSLPTLISLAASLGLSPAQTTLVMTRRDQPAIPVRPFMALGAHIAGVSHQVTMGEDGQIRVGLRTADWLSPSAAQGSSAAQIVHSHGQHGIVWYALGSQSMPMERPFRIATGTTVILGPAGPLSWLRGDEPAELSRGPADSAFYEWRKQWSWGAPIVLCLLVVFVLLLLLARFYRRKNDNTH